MLTVLNVADPFVPVGREAIGGAEQVLAAIDEALVEAGQRSLVMACPGSKPSGELIAIDLPSDTLDEARRREVRAAYREAIERVLGQRSIDVVHLHGADALEYMPESFRPVIVTLHLPIDRYPSALFTPPSGVLLTCVSAAQRATCEPGTVIHATIENGVDVERYRPVDGSPAGFAVCLGRIAEEKGFDIALRAAREAKMTLFLAGSAFPYPEHESYLSRKIVPLLDQRRCFIGPVSGPTKRRLLARARCVVIPSRIAETSSLVAMESLASGTPVLALPSGALPSIVEHGRTGLIVPEEHALSDAFARVRLLDRFACRRAAEQRFDARRMTTEYLELYRTAAKSAAQPSQPERVQHAT